MGTRRIPVIVLAGFLGSGKTTLLNWLLRRGRGTRIGAVVNDFGSIEIDAMTVAGQVDSMVSLGDGCLCCAVDTSDLDGVLERLAEPSAGMDVIVVEASGLAEPETLFRMILASGSEHIVYGGLVEVVDAAEFHAVRERHPELDRHVRAADLVVLNKTDRVADQQRDDLYAELSALSPGTPVVPASYGRVDPALLFDPAVRERPAVEQLSFDALLYEDEEEEHQGHGGEADHGGACGEECAHSAHLHAAYQSVEFTSERPMDPRRLLEFLDARPDGLYRIKGFVDFGAVDPEQRYGVHAVGGFLRFAPGAWERGEERRTQLVLIGTGLEAEALRASLAACVAPDGAVPDERAERALWSVQRYVDAERPEEPEEEDRDGDEPGEGDPDGRDPDEGRYGEDDLEPLAPEDDLDPVR
ncbi:GTP-binding protein [Streptomyces sp. ODS28]|uniref:CobW family GTP-binding protein n=1 Tax=Streptomyces sp. ODS28 TaxID=3136688 RepID=UPI0031EFC61F